MDDPLLQIAIEPRSRNGRRRLAAAVRRLTGEDPSLPARVDEETGRAVIGGADERALTALADRIGAEAEVEAGRPRVVHRETIRRPAEGVEYVHARQAGCPSHFAKVRITVEPAGTPYEFVDESRADRIPREYVPAVDEGCREAMRRGVLAAGAMTGIRVILLGGAFHEIDSSARAYRIAGAGALRRAVRQAGPVLLEPVMLVRVAVPGEHADAVVADLGARRGLAEAARRPGGTTVEALVPLAEMLGYATDLHAMTAGRATYTMVLDSYAEAPENTA
ncbi:hypothetical protein GCM10009678_12620 [Actinomadura kijaniata]|uniref:Translation elongation factor EF-G n=1 Tax=Actinomadura namibiensis TaxID=182080 RepID=A0A7W3QLF5_ACTNM|nr:hypothetical protein [Actinomadura namibiensis]MBA8951386.1 translation elongation factor EF-G [Actinomadura namibiensis]